MKEYAFGIDLGGTTAKVGLFTTSGALLEKWEVPTDTSNAGEHILENLADAIHAKMAEKEITSEQVEASASAYPAPCWTAASSPSSAPTSAAGANGTSRPSCPACWTA